MAAYAVDLSPWTPTRSADHRGRLRRVGVGEDELSEEFPGEGGGLPVVTVVHLDDVEAGGV